MRGHGLLVPFLAGTLVAQEATPPVSLAEETIELTPFEVSASTNDTYHPNNTNSVTGTNTSLDRTPLDARVFNRLMMDELDVVDVASMLSTVGGLGMPLYSAGNEGQRGMQDGDTMDYKSMTSRGLTISNPRRDGFLRSDTSLMDSFDVESAEALQGSNSLLFGSGDAGGVVNVNSKRARLKKMTARFSARFDSEGSERYTFDGNAGNSKMAVRLNAVRGRELFDRPLIAIRPEGVQVSATLRPLSWITISAEHRDFTRDHIRPNYATVRAPTTLRMPNGETLDGQYVRYLTGMGGSSLINDYLNFTNQDSILGVFNRHYYENQIDSVTMELTPSRDWAFQFRYGVDDRVNRTLGTSNTTIYHPDASGNAYTTDSGVLRHEWALKTSMMVKPWYQVARGSKFTAVHHRDLGRWGDHWINAFISRQEQESYEYGERYYEVGENGNVIQDLSKIRNSESGRNAMPAIWVPVFPTQLIGNVSWPSSEIIHPNGKRYRLQPQIYAGAVAPTSANPLGLSGPVDATTGAPTGDYSSELIRENSVGFSSFSSFWRRRIDAMAGFRFERADFLNLVSNETRGPLDYDSMTLGVVFDTPISGLRGYANYATNARITFDTAKDINNVPLPIGRGLTREVGLKFSMWEHRLSGNLTYYQSKGRNFAGSLGSLRDEVDPDGINGRHGGNGYVYDKISDGLSASFTFRPMRWWQSIFSYTQADGSERSSVRLPILYNDEFNTMTSGGQTVVAIKGAGGALTPLTVLSVPSNPASAKIPLSLAMMRDSSSPYFAQLDAESGQILNAEALGLRTTGVGTDRNGLPISAHQLGFAPVSDTVVVREAGERTTGYAENSFSFINRFQVSEGRLRGTVFGWSTLYREGLRAYSYTDVADGGARKVFYYPDQLMHNAFASYQFKLRGLARMSLQMNISNVFNKQCVVTLLRSTTGTVRYFTNQYSPRKFSVTATVEF